ncbi:phosphatase PAP2 family protein [Haloferula rosea]|uniref:Phosphatase PAP2 family protein n=1 Tax=Haloferula rosea TaxID=490093 RepID=A0A934VEX4_9BACT|nr:phosphatase PAP2 family protein [Haloferula rosea]MBK1826382.1 phosphatase PAP2 family protein [Haloferula rosea]
MKGLIVLWNLVVVAVVAADDFKHLSGAGADAACDGVGFRNTSAWGREFSEWARGRTKFLPADWKQRFQLVEPPANSSARTRAELEFLVEQMEKREQHQEAINREILVENFRFGDHRYEDLITRKEFSKTGELLKLAYLDLTVVTFVFKQRFDRVRPSVLAGRLEIPLSSSIEIPGHPAYPSGHATGAYGLAYLLQELNPDQAGRYLEDARRIGENREVAGVHFPSDTEAGRLLARQIVDGLLSNSSFVRLLEEARSEWK